MSAIAMVITTYDLFIEPILRYLAQHPQGAPAQQVHEAAADALGLNEFLIDGTDWRVF